tara:strand:+ start:99 stop:1736 length:1638 start_codon:yes stop_codon:yes gene_type:complete
MKNFKLSDIKIFFIVLISLVIFLQGIFLIPPLDRDESRFAAATKNMIESENYIDIQLENVPRYKKPIGIYWAQAVFTKFLGTTPYNDIWTYRLPSLTGLILSVILIYFFCRRIFNHEVSILSVFFLSTSLLFISEVHQAKTDGFLFLFISICNLIILSSIENFKNKNKNKKLLTIYWISMAIGVLIKGPIIIIFTILPLIVFSIICKNANLLKYIHFPLGYLFFLILVLPWFFLITIESNGLFWYESVVHDLFKKVASGQESHGFPPGYYTILLLIFFWPGSAFLIDSFKNYFLSFKKSIINNKQKLFLFCCFFPCFLTFELIPTKLPHYVFPSYLSLSILISISLYENFQKNNIMNLKTLITYSIYPIIFFSIFFISIYIYSSININVLVVAFLLSLFFLLSLNQLLKKSLAKFVFTAGIFQISVYLSIVYVLNPHLNIFWISKTINEVTSYEGDVNGIYHFGYNEPSLVFLIGHKSKRLDTEKMLKKFNSDEKNIFVLTEPKMKEFSKKNYADDKFFLIKSFKGFNYSQGKYLKFFIFKNYAT